MAANSLILFLVINDIALSCAVLSSSNIILETYDTLRRRKKIKMGKQTILLFSVVFFPSSKISVVVVTMSMSRADISTDHGSGSGIGGGVLEKINPIDFISEGDIWD
jgi:hypothetical protein